MKCEVWQTYFNTDTYSLNYTHAWYWILRHMFARCVDKTQDVAWRPTNAMQVLCVQKIAYAAPVFLCIWANYAHFIISIRHEINSVSQSGRHVHYNYNNDNNNNNNNNIYTVVTLVIFWFNYLDIMFCISIHIIH